MRLSMMKKSWGKWHKESKGKRRTEFERFWVKVDIRGDNDCWPWLGGKLFKSAKGHVSPVRYAWAFASEEEVPNSIRIQHRNWGNQTGTSVDYCCNPRHLYAIIDTNKAVRFLKKQLMWSWNWSDCLQKFYKNIAKDNSTGCWNWTGDTKAKGYGRFVMSQTYQHKTTYWAAHRLSWILSNKMSLEKEDHVHHTCRNKGCINPDHLIKMLSKEHGRLHGKEVKEVWDLVRSKYIVAS